MFDLNMPSNLEFFVEVGPSGFTVGSVDPPGAPNGTAPSSNGASAGSGAPGAQGTPGPGEDHGELR